MNVKYFDSFDTEDLRKIKGIVDELLSDRDDSKRERYKIMIERLGEGEILYLPESDTRLGALGYHRLEICVQITGTGSAKDPYKYQIEDTPLEEVRDELPDVYPTYDRNERVKRYSIYAYFHPKLHNGTEMFLEPSTLKLINFKYKDANIVRDYKIYNDIPWYQ